MPRHLSYHLLEFLLRPGPVTRRRSKDVRKDLRCCQIRWNPQLPLLLETLLLGKYSPDRRCQLVAFLEALGEGIPPSLFPQGDCQVEDYPVARTGSLLTSGTSLWCAVRPSRYPCPFLNQGLSVLWLLREINRARIGGLSRVRSHRLSITRPTSPRIGSLDIFLLSSM